MVARRNRRPVRDCALCLDEKELCDSHILPEFFYDPMYDEGHAYEVVSGGIDNTFDRQKGLWEHLLCVECEGRIGDWEDYAKPFLYGRDDIDAEQDGQKILTCPTCLTNSGANTGCPVSFRVISRPSE